MRNLKKGLVSLLAVAILVVSIAGSAFAASSPVWGVKKGKVTGTYWYRISSNYAVKKAPKSKTVKTDVVNATVTAKGKTYKVTKLGANLYSKCTKLNKIKIKSTNLTQVNKAAFKGLKKSQINKINVYVTKKMTKKNFLTLYKNLTKVGINSKRISYAKTF